MIEKWSLEQLRAAIVETNNHKFLTKQEQVELIRSYLDRIEEIFTEKQKGEKQ